MNTKKSHDGVFKTAFRNPKRAASLLKTLLTDIGHFVFSCPLVYIWRWRRLMATITMDIPEDILNFMVCNNKCDELRRNALLLYPFIKNETISHGRAAEILGISKWELIELYGNEGIPYIDQSWEEVEQDAANVKALLSKR